MDILAFTDIHSSQKSLSSIKKLSKKAEILVCSGDLSIFGHGLEETLTALDSIGKPVILIHGNHEDEEYVRTFCEGLRNTYFVHQGILLYNDVAFMGYGGGGFAYTDKRFEMLFPRMLKEVPAEAKKVVLLLHQPPFGTTMDVVYGEQHVGNKSFTKMLETTKRVHMVICGHIHEGFETKDKIGKCDIVNPGSKGMLLRI